MRGIRAFMGRRQFLKGALATSAAGLTSKIAMGPFKPGTKAAWAGVAETAGASEVSDEAGVFSDRYRHMLSPLKIGNVVIKNRMMHTRSHPHFMQGPESFPTEATISHYAQVARTAAIVTVRSETLPLTKREDLSGDRAHMPIWDVYDPSVQNYLSQMADAVHFYDAKASFGMKLNTPSGYAISNAKMPGSRSSGKEIPVEVMQQMIEDAVGQCVFFQSLGYDMVNVYMAYRAHILAHALSPAMNTRTDRYGGSLENRGRFPLELFKAIKKACGPDFLIEAQISGEEPEGGYTVSDLVEYLKIFDGTLDIVQLRARDASLAHPMGWNSEKGQHVTLPYAEAVKKSGVGIITAPIGGYQDLDLNESYIADGKTDMIAMARAYICDPDYGQKAAEGRGEDVIPCIKCNKCHGISMTSVWLDMCSVNPKMGIAQRVNRMVDPFSAPKKVAVIGGGPAGMKAAVVAAERGHAVTLYEKSGFLGGLLHHTGASPFRWPLRDFKDYLIRQVEKCGVKLHLNTEATPEMIRAKDFDAVIVATGADPIMPRIPGSDGDHVWDVVSVYANEKALGKDIVLIGGGEYGVGTAGFLARAGHRVTVLTSDKELVQRAGPHQMEVLLEVITSLENFDYILEANPSRISNGGVIYTDAEGREKSIQADDVVIYAGLKAKKDEALKFYGSAKRFFIIGDCREVGNVQTCNRTAFAAASLI